MKRMVATCRKAWSIRAFRETVFLSCAVVVWAFSQTAVQDAIVFGSFVFALFSPRRTLRAWKTPAGMGFAVLLLHAIVTIPLSLDPGLSFRDFVRMLEIYAGVYAITCIFDSRDRVRYALTYSAVAVAIVLLYDLVRLYVNLGESMFREAHTYRPFILNHSNVAAMMAGAGALVFFYMLWTFRRNILPAFFAAAGLLVCLLYQVVAASRGPQIAFALTCGAAGFIMPGWKKKTGWMVFLLLAAWLLVTFSGAINSRMKETESMRNFSERTSVWSHTWELCSERPLLGHGFGKRNFENIYYSSNPPEAAFQFPHTHEFWLKILFEYGWPGLVLHMAVWSILAWQLLGHVFRQQTYSERILPGTVALLILFTHLYGLGDFPDHVVKIMQYWLVPLALVLTSQAGSSPQRPIEHDPMS